MRTFWQPRMVLCFVLLLASACAPAATSAAPTAAAPSGTVSFMVSGDPAELKAYEAVVAGFEARYPLVNVELITIASGSDYTQRLASDVAAGAPADVVLINYRAAANYAAKGALSPLSSELAQSSLIQASDFYDQAIAAFRWGGNQMCIPQNISSLVVFYNKDLFDAAGVAYPRAGWTWDDFLATAQKLTLDADSNGQTDQFGLGTDPIFIRLAPFIWQNGGELIDADSTQLTLDTPAALEAAQFFVDLQVKHHVVPNAVEEQSEDSQSRFENGRLAMLLQSRRPTPTFREVAAFDWDVAALPRNRQTADILHSDGYCRPAAAAHPELAWTLIEYANSPDGQRLVAATGRSVPSLKSVAESPAFLDPNAKPANSRVWLDAIATMHVLPLLPYWGEIEEVAGEELQRAYYGSASTEEAMQSAIERTRRYFAP